MSLLSLPSDPACNHLLAELTDAEWQRLRPHLECVELKLGQVICDSGMAQSHVYFPASAIVSLLYRMASGASAEIATVGNEGLVGVSLLLGGGSTPSQGEVVHAGQAFRITAQAIKDEFNRGGPLMHLLLRYTQALTTQIAQAAVCNRHHSLDQRLCSWLLLSLDRLQGNEIVMTQELLASLLGVRRETVTAAALKLHSAGLIRYVRGHITVLDRAGLEHCSCECYGVVKRECHRLLPESKAMQCAGAGLRAVLARSAAGLGHAPRPNVAVACAA